MENYIDELKTCRGKGRNYRTEDLVIFSVNNKTVLTKENAKNYKLSNSKYCMIGYFNKDKTKFKDVVTGDIYDGVRDLSLCSVCMEIFSTHECQYIREKVTERDRDGSLELFIATALNGRKDLGANLKITKEDKIYDLLRKFVGRGNYIDDESIKEIVIVLNEKIEKLLNDLMKENAKDIKHQKILEEATLTDEEKDF